MSQHPARPKMSAEARANLNRELERFEDWEGQCFRCNEKIRGSLKQIRKHREECKERVDAEAE